MYIPKFEVSKKKLDFSLIPPRPPSTLRPMSFTLVCRTTIRREAEAGKRGERGCVAIAHPFLFCLKWRKTCQTTVTLHNFGKAFLLVWEYSVFNECCPNPCGDPIGFPEYWAYDGGQSYRMDAVRHRAEGTCPSLFPLVESSRWLPPMHFEYGCTFWLITILFTYLFLLLLLWNSEPQVTLQNVCQNRVRVNVYPCVGLWAQRWWDLGD